MEIISNSKNILNQLSSLIHLLTKEEYKSQLTILNKSSIGQHIRHIIEFYIEFDNGYKSGNISYDNRERKLQLETNQALVTDELKRIINTLQKYDLNKELLIESNHGLNQNETILSKSSCRREIVYALDHTIHHLAIIKIAFQVEFKHIKIIPNLGIAPSTLRNNNKICAQ